MNNDNNILKGYDIDLTDADIIFQGRFWNHLEIYWWFLKRKVVILLGFLWIQYRLLVLTKLNLSFHEDCLSVWIILYFCLIRVISSYYWMLQCISPIVLIWKFTHLNTHIIDLSLVGYTHWNNINCIQRYPRVTSY